MAKWMVAVAAALVVGIVVGGAMGFAGGVSYGPGASPDGPVPAAASLAVVAAAADGAESAAARRPVRGRASAADSADTGRAVDVAPAATGTGVITGTVVGVDGAPLAGALVRASPTNDADAADAEEPHVPPGSPPPREDVERRLREIAAEMRRRESVMRETTTDAQGAYAFSTLTDSPHYVEAWLAGWRIDPIQRERWTPVPIGGRFDFKATPLRAVTFRVLLPDGTSPRRATINWSRVGEPGEQCAPWRGAAPQVDLPPGAYEISAAADPDEPTGRGRRGFERPSEALYRSEPEPVTVSSDAAQTVTLRLAARPGVFARVVFASAEHPRTVRVAVTRLDGGAGADPRRLLVDDESVVWRRVAEPFEAAFTDLTPGAYLVGATYRAGQIGPTATVTVGADLVTQELRVPAGEPRDWVKAWVRAPDDSLLSDVKFSVGIRRGDQHSSDDTDAAPQPDGSFRVEHFEGDASWLGDGARSGASDDASRADDAARAGARYFVRATSAFFADAETSYDPASDREIVVRFAQPALLRVVLGGFDESPNKDRVSLSLQSAAPRDEDGYREPPTIGADGTAAFQPVKPGDYLIYVQLARREAADKSPIARRRNRVSYGGAVVATVAATLRPGDNVLHVPMPAVCDLVVLQDPGGADDVSLERVDGRRDPNVWSRPCPERGGGGTTFPDLAPGRYRIVSETGDMLVDVPAQNRVVFKPRTFNCLRYTSNSDMVPGARAQDGGLLSDDLVVAVDGDEIENLRQAEALLAVARMHESAKFTVIRGGKRTDVAMDAKRLDECGRLDPWAR